MGEEKERAIQGPVGDRAMERRGKLGRTVSAMFSHSVPFWIYFLNLLYSEKYVKHKCTAYELLA